MALEESGSVGGESGWLPRYLLVERDGNLLAATAAFLKTDSYGEYIFDWGWARASQQAGLRYYPKLVVAAPFTPATGSRLLIRPDLDPGFYAAVLVGGLRELVAVEPRNTASLIGLAISSIGIIVSTAALKTFWQP
jgi:predicted N-acyltransferase